MATWKEIKAGANFVNKIPMVANLFPHAATQPSKLSYVSKYTYHKYSNSIKGWVASTQKIPAEFLECPMSKQIPISNDQLSTYSRRIED
jgi:hypothetical protein